MSRRAAAVLVAAVVTVAGACSGESSAGVVVDDAWIRPTPPVSNVAAFYLTVRNDGETVDAVVGASAPRCQEIEIHQTSTVDGVASMGPAERAQLEVAPGAGLVFEPSGLHVMCLGLDEPVVAGERLTLTVELDRAGSVMVEAVAENR